MKVIDEIKSNIIHMWQNLDPLLVTTKIIDSYFVVNCKYMFDPLFNYGIELSTTHSQFSRVEKYFASQGKSCLQWKDDAENKPLFTDLVGMQLDLRAHSKKTIKPNAINVVKTREDLNGWVVPVQEEFQLSASDALEFTRILSKTLHDPKFTHYTYTIDREVVASLTLFTLGEISGLYNGATKKQYQGQGIMSTMLSVAINDAVSSRQTTLVAQAGIQSRGLLQRFGFDVKQHYHIYTGQQEQQFLTKNWAKDANVARVSN